MKPYKILLWNSEALFLPDVCRPDKQSFAKFLRPATKRTFKQLFSEWSKKKKIYFKGILGIATFPFFPQTLTNFPNTYLNALWDHDHSLKVFWLQEGTASCKPPPCALIYQAFDIDKVCNSKNILPR